jgi:hypothetical protein
LRGDENDLAGGEPAKIIQQQVQIVVFMPCLMACRCFAVKRFSQAPEAP